MKFSKEEYIYLMAEFLQKEKMPVMEAFIQILDYVEQDVNNIIREFRKKIDTLNGKEKKEILSFFSDDVTTQIPSDLFIRFMKRFKVIQELFFEQLDPAYLDSLTVRIQKKEIVLEEPGFIPKFDDLFSKKRYYASEDQKKICKTFIPILIKIREIIEEYSDDSYSKYFISKNSISKVSEILTAIKYNLFWDCRFLSDSPNRSGIRFYIDTQKPELSQTTLYNNRLKALSGVLSRLEEMLTEEEINALYGLICYTGSEHPKRDRFKSLPFYMNGQIDCDSDDFEDCDGEMFFIE